MAEGLVNSAMNHKGVTAFSAGSEPTGRVNPNAMRVLEERGAWRDEYRSKSIDEILGYGPFDLVVTVCSEADEKCPSIPGESRRIHIGFEDPDGKGYEAFVETADLIGKRLLPEMEKILYPPNP
jgi:arsenate reductase